MGLLVCGADYELPYSVLVASTRQQSATIAICDCLGG